MTKRLPNPVIIAILAGGKATRFGGKDKGEISIRDERLIDIIHNRLLPQSNEIILSGTHDYGLGLPVVSDIVHAPGGPVGGLYSIWAHLQGRNVEGFFTVAVDGPNVPQNLMACLYAQDFSSIACDEHGRHPTYGWWRMADLSNVFKSLILSNSLSLNRVANLIHAREIMWEKDESFININHQDDLSKFVKGA